jgi:hypothetical protein
MNEKLRAIALDAEGRREEASRAWLQAARSDLETLIDQPMSVPAWAELIACLVNASRSVLKEEMRERVQRVLSILNTPP